MAVNQGRRSASFGRVGCARFVGFRRFFQRPQLQTKWSATHFPHREYSSSPHTTHPPLRTPVMAPETASPYCCSTYSDRYSGYYPGYYSPPPLPPPRPFFNRASSSYYETSGASAPVDLSSYDHKTNGSKMGVSAGVAVGAVADEGIEYEKEKFAERVESNIPARDNHRDYRGGY